MSRIRKNHNHRLQTNQWHCEEEPHNNHETPGRQTKQSCKTRMDIKKRTTNIEQLQNPTIGVTINNKSTPTEYPNTYTLLSLQTVCTQISFYRSLSWFCRPWSWPNTFGTLIAPGIPDFFLMFCEKVSFENKSAYKRLSGSVVECLTRGRRAAGSSLTGVTALCPWAKTLILA